MSSFSAVFEILLHVGLTLYRTWMKSTSTIKSRLTSSDGKAALNTMTSAATGPLQVADSSENDAPDIHRIHDTLHHQSDLINCSADNGSSPPSRADSTSSHAKCARLRHQQGNNFSSVEVIEAKSAGGPYTNYYRLFLVENKVLK